MWVKVSCEDEMNNHIEKFKENNFADRIGKYLFKTPGWYFLETISVKCPRGCCSDQVVKATHISEKIDNIKDKIKKLSSELVELRKKEVQ